jgi:uncharacterized membrane protein YqiK
MAEPENQLAPRREYPGWMAIALIVVFVLTGVVMYWVGVHLIKR